MSETPQSFHDFGCLGQGTSSHGTRANYRAGCHCTPCRAANAAYELQRAQARANGEPAEWVSPEQAKAKLEMFDRIGIGHRHAAKLAGVSVATVRRIRQGRCRRIRARVSAAILGVQQPSLAWGVHVNGYETRHYVESLEREDYSLRGIAARLGIRCGRLRLGRNVTVATALKVWKLHEDLTAEE